MAFATSNLGLENVLRDVHDPSTQSLRTNATATVVIPGGLEVDIDQATDSIKIGDGVNLFTSTQVGPKTGLDVAIINQAEVKMTNTLVKDPFDYIQAAYPDSVTEVYTYKLGGVLGSLVATVTVTYTDSTKDLIQSVGVV
jgi:hypothetical protein